MSNKPTECVPMLKQMVCLLSCQPRNLTSQLPAALECLKSALGVRAVGVCWPHESGALRPLAQRPPHFRLDSGTLQVISDPRDLAHASWGKTSVSWLAVPMKVGGAALGRLWLVDQPQRDFSQDEREFAMMGGNQLALAMENSRLYDETQRLAARRGELLRRVTAAQDERCRRISRELHDEISQSLAAIALDLETLRIAGLPVNPGETMARLAALRGRLLATLKEVNRIVLDLRPTLLEDMGLMPALQWYARQRLGDTGIRVHIRATHMNDRLSPHLETTLYRIAQEALTNIARHAEARQVWLTMTRTDRRIALSVRDDGRGFEVNPVVSPPDDRVGLGLFGMKERAVLAGGTFAVDSHPGKGTRIIVRIPVEQEREHDTNSAIAG